MAPRAAAGSEGGLGCLTPRALASPGTRVVPARTIRTVSRDGADKGNATQFIDECNNGIVKDS